jgi:hypothetical protein
LALNSFAQAQTGFHLDPEIQQVPWSQLSFHAKNFWVEVSTDIQMKSLRTSDLDAVLLTSPKGMPIKPQKSQINEMTINTIIDPRFRSAVKIHNRTWFNPADASALGRIRLRRGEDDFKKMYRFTDQGVFRHQIEPKNKSEARLEPDKWTDIKNTFYPYDMKQLNCPMVSERSVLIFILSAAAISKDKPLTVCIFGKRQLHRVQLRNDSLLPIKANYIEKKQGSPNRKETLVHAHKIEIKGQSLYTGKEASENFSFLGFQRDITIYIESSTGLPIQASGIIPTIGKAHLRLREYQIMRPTY